MRKRNLALFISLAMLLTVFAVPVSAAYPDTHGHWAENAISTWSGHGVIQGDGEGFRPDDSITRAETATILNNVIGYIDLAADGFYDVESGSWYADAILKLKAAGVLKGDGDGNVRPESNISREEAVVMFARAFGLQANSASPAGYGDAGEISSWAATWVGRLTQLGYIQGSDGLFRPQDAITRAEMVTILDNMVDLYLPQGGTYWGKFGDGIVVVKAGNTVLTNVIMGGALISPQVGSGKVTFNNNTKINGNLTNLAPNADIRTAGATIASSTGMDDDDSSITILPGGGSSSGNGNSGIAIFSLSFHANGGSWGGTTLQTATCYNGSTLGSYVPKDPERTGYRFMGWYTSMQAAEKLESAALISLDSRVSSSNSFYAGWEKTYAGELEFGVSASNDLYGKKASDLMENVAVNPTGRDNTYEVTGKSNYVLDYSQWSSEPTLSQGNYIALELVLPDDMKDYTKVVVKYKGLDGETTFNEFTENKKSLTVVWRVNDLVAQNKPITYTVDYDGNGTSYSPETYTIYVNNLQLGTADWSDPNNQTPVTPVEDVYPINTPQELAWVANQVNSGSGEQMEIQLASDLDLKGYQWEPIGTTEKPFQGSFNGNGKSITNLKLENSAEIPDQDAPAHLALFGYVEGTVEAPAEIKNLNVQGDVVNTIAFNPEVNDDLGRYTALVAAEVKNVNLENITTSGSVTSQCKTVGGIVAKVVVPQEEGSTVTIKNCVNYANVNGYFQTGGVVAYVRASGEKGSVNITQCANYGAISSDTNAGGLVGLATQTNITESKNAGTVTTTGGNAGGIVGVYNSGNQNYKIENCYNTGAVNGGTATAGGILGMDSAGLAQLRYCYSTGQVTSAHQGNGEVTTGAGIYGGTSGTFSTRMVRNYYLAGTAAFGACSGYLTGETGAVITGQPDQSGQYEEKNEEQMKQIGYALNNNATGEETVWRVAPAEANTGYPVLSWEYPDAPVPPVVSVPWNGTDKEPVQPVGCVYSLSTPAHLAWIAEQINAGEIPAGSTILLTDDLDLNHQEWTPIGAASRSEEIVSGQSFQGIFDGGGHTISGLTITQEPAANTGVGLFSAISGQGTVVKNIILEDVNISLAENEATGGIAGLVSEGASVTGCTVKGSITSGRGIGGIVGRGIAQATITDCRNEAEITAMKPEKGNVGGIAGAMYYVGDIDTLQISNCVNTGRITGGAATAGIVGLMATGGVIGCTNEGAVVSSTGTSVGGIVGELKYGSLIQDSNNSGSVDAAGSWAGGIVGWIRYPIDPSYDAATGTGRIENCHNTGNVTLSGSYSVGGVVGGIYNKAEVISSSNSGAVKGTGEETNMIGGVVGNVQFSDDNRYYADGTVWFENCENLSAEITQAKENDGMTNTIIGHYAETLRVLFQGCTSVDIEGMKTGVKVPTVEVATLAELNTALENEVIQKIVVKNNIALASGEYGPADGQMRKTLEMHGAFTLPDRSEITIRNLDFVTPGKQIISNLIYNNSEDAEKVFCFRNNTVTGAFASVLPNILSGTIEIKDNVFTNTYTEDGGFTGNISNNTCLSSREHAGNFTITGNTFDGYGTAITYAVYVGADDVSVNFTKNRFQNNVMDILAGSSNKVSDVSYNSFQDAPVINGGYFVYQPYYTDAACTKLSPQDAAKDGYLVYQNEGEATSTVSYLGGKPRISLKADGTNCTVRVIPADQRNAVKIDGTATTSKVIQHPGDVMVQVGDKTYTVPAFVGGQSIETDVYLSTDKAKLKREESKVAMDVTSDNTFKKALPIPEGKDGDFIYIWFATLDPNVSIDSISMNNAKGFFRFECADNTAKIPYELANHAFGDYEYIMMTITLGNGGKTGYYYLSFTDTTGDNTPKAQDLTGFVGTYQPVGALEKGSNIEIVNESGTVKARFTEEVQRGTGDLVPLSELEIDAFLYGADGAYKGYDLKFGYSAYAYFHVGTDNSLTAAKDNKFRLNKEEANVLQFTGLIPEGTVFTKAE